MEKKTKLTISGNVKKKIERFNYSSSKKNTSIILDRPTNSDKSKVNTRPVRRPTNTGFKKNNLNQNKKNFVLPNDFERRKLAEQRARKRIKGEENLKDTKNKFGSKKRELKLTLSRALSDTDEALENKGRSLAALRRAKLKENRNVNDEKKKEDYKPVKRDVNIPEAITVRELSNRMAEQSGSVIKHLMGMGVTVTINQTLAADTAEYLVKEFGHNPIREQKAEEIVKNIKNINFENLKNRPPIVTVMGHVDHGKTSLLDVLRSANVVAGEHGGITQHVGAYQIEKNSKKITFIDTPGHAAFTEMRARGSKLTDVVVLVVAADDGVKPQTVESINHAKAAKVPIVVAINKCDLHEADPQKIKNQLLEHELIAEELSGDTLMVEISTKTKKNLDKLIDSIILQAEILDLKTDYKTNANGIVLESKIDIGRGPVVSTIITSGTLKKGNFFACGMQWGKVRAILNDSGKNVPEAYPSSPIEILGINGAAKAGDDFIVFDTEKEAKELCKKRLEEHKTGKNPIAIVTQESAFKDNTIEELNIIIKSDVHGSSEAIKNAINKITHDEVKLKIILSEIGMISETDVTLAKASNAILIAFNVKPNKEAKKKAELEKVKISSFNIIYEVIDFIKQNMSGLLEPNIEEEIVGSAEILEIFKVSKIGKVAGSKVIEGEIKADLNARLIRDGSVIHNGKINTIFREKDQVKNVSEGLECGITLKNYSDFQKKDIIEVFSSIVTERTV